MRDSWINQVEKLSVQERNRNSRAKPYTGIAYLDSPTRKQKGSPIIGTDAIKGCRNDCFRCYANRMSRFNGKVFSEPVLCFVVGIPDPKLVYRFGTFGDPAEDWEWTFRELDRLQGRGMRKFYVLTKLQSIDAFRNDPELCLHVSFDPLNQEQLDITKQNFDAIVAKRIVRLKSIRSGHKIIMARQEDVIAFAQERNAPLLETRFYTNVRDDLRLLRMQGYKKKGSLFKYPGSVLEDCFGLKDHHRICDKSNSGKCLDCLNCMALL